MNFIFGILPGILWETFFWFFFIGISNGIDHVFNEWFFVVGSLHNNQFNADDDTCGSLHVLHFNCAHVVFPDEKKKTSIECYQYQ